MKGKDISKYISSLERKIRRLEEKVKHLNEFLKSGKRKLPKNKTREKIIKFIKLYPESTIREIQKKLKISSPSVVDFHLKQIRKYEEL